jgi:hypothetical protein
MLGVLNDMTQIELLPAATSTGHGFSFGETRSEVIYKKTRLDNMETDIKE